MLLQPISSYSSFNMRLTLLKWVLTPFNIGRAEEVAEGAMRFAARHLREAHTSAAEDVNTLSFLVARRIMAFYVSTYLLLTTSTIKRGEAAVVGQTDG